MRDAGDWLLRALADEGIDRLFGNPGSTELPLMDALARQDAVRYVLGLHEGAVVGMADGWAQATGRTAAVNLHVTPGLANGLAGILNARRARVPMLVTVGTQHTALAGADPFLGGDIVAMARGVAAHAVEATTAARLPGLLHECLRVARTPPCGPVVLGLPLDVQVAAAPPAHVPRRGPAAASPDPGAVDAAAAMLADARAPVVVAGDELARSDAGEVLANLAARLGAPVWGEPHAGRAPVAWSHAAWRGYLPPMGDAIRAALDGHDVVLAVGCPVFRVFGHSGGPLLPPGCALVHADADGIGRNAAPAVGIAAGPAAFVTALAARLRDTPPATERLARVVAANARRRRDALRAAAAPRPGISPGRLSRALAASVRPGDMLVDESLTSGRWLRRMPAGRRRGNWMAHRGSALGWGTPAAVGAALASPGRHVVCLQGDGSLVFGVPALWTAARHGSRVGLVVADNSGYEILRAGLRSLTGRPGGAWPDVEVTGLDPAGLVRAFGVPVERVDDARDLDAALAGLRTRTHDGPAALVVRVTPDPPPG